MKEDNLKVIYFKKPKRTYSSYRGEISKAPENLLQRNFHAPKPHMVWLTDIIYFRTHKFSAYLSALIDYFNGEVVSYTLSQNPTQKLVNTMLKKAIDALKPDEYPILNSDKLAHHKNESHLNLCGCRYSEIYI